MKKVIIPEDIEAVLRKEQNFLFRSDMSILTATSNEDALNLHKAEKADLIIAKLDSPGMSGEELCSAVRDSSKTRAVSIIVICADTETDRERCIKCRANGFITTPVNTAVLLQEAHHLLHIAGRRSCRIPVKAKLQGTSEKISYTGYAENISASGMMFRSGATFFEGDTILFSFALPDSTRIKANAEIVRCLGTGDDEGMRYYGVSFIDLNKKALSAIEAFIEKEFKYESPALPNVECL